METYNVKDIADLLKTNPETVRRWIRSGKLKATRGASKKEGSSISSDDLLKFLENNAKYAGIVAGAASSPIGAISVALLGAAGGIAALKHENDRTIENSTATQYQIRAYLNNEIQRLSEGVEQKEKVASQLKAEIKRDKARINEMRKVILQLSQEKSKSIEG